MLTKLQSLGMKLVRLHKIAETLGPSDNLSNGLNSNAGHEINTNNIQNSRRKLLYTET